MHFQGSAKAAYRHTLVKNQHRNQTNFADHAAVANVLAVNDNVIVDVIVDVNGDGW